MLRVTHGPHVGRISSNGVRIWLRLEKEGYARVRYAPGSLPDEDISEKETYANFFKDTSPSVPQKAKKENDFIVTIDLEEGLEENTAYIYAVEISDDGAEYVVQPVERRLLGYFKTFPKAEELKEELVFGLGSCFYPHKNGDQVFQGLDQRSNEEKGLRFLLLIGDQIYADLMPKELTRKKGGVWKRNCLLTRFREAIDFEAYKCVYRSFWSSIRFRQALMRIPTFMTLDDHEFRNGWGLEGENDPNSEVGRHVAEQRAAALKAYELYQHKLNPKTPKGRYWYQFNYGDIGFFVLDTRTSRDRQSEVMLDEHQMEALKHWLESNKETFPIKFIVSSVPIVHISWFLGIYIPKIFPEAGDQWPGFHTQRLDLLNFIFDKGISGVHFLSGDVHISHMAKITKEGTENEIFSFTSSPLAMDSPFLHEWAALKDRINKKFRVTPIFKGAGKNFGLIRVKPQKRDRDQGNKPHDVSYEFYDKHAEVFFRYPGKAKIVLDVDRTISTSRVLKRKSVPYLNAPKIVRRLHERFGVVYLTARPRFLWFRVRLVRHWLRDHDFPPSQIIMMRKLRYIFPWRHDDYKIKMIKHMMDNQGYEPLIGIGDKRTDAIAYKKCGLKAIIINTYGGDLPPDTDYVIDPDPEFSIWERIAEIVFEEIG